MTHCSDAQIQCLTFPSDDELRMIIETRQQHTSRLMAFRFTSLPSFTPRCSSVTISVIALTRACSAVHAAFRL